MQCQTFVINLDRNPERMDFMKSQLDRLGLPFVRFPAIDGRTFDFDQIEAAYHARNQTVLPSRGELGCALSHRLVLESMLSGQYEYALVLEDDVELSPDFKVHLMAALERHAAGTSRWEYLTFNYPSPGWRATAQWLFLFRNHFLKHRRELWMWLKLPVYLVKCILIALVHSIEGVRNWIYEKAHWGGPVNFHRDLYLAGCYLVTRAGAEKMVRLNHELAYTADAVPNEARKKLGLKFFGYVPHLARQKREIFPSILDGGKNFGKKVVTY